MKRYLAVWYVYELIDPRTDMVFYVGKGARNRLDAHENEAKSGINSYKCNKIRSIWEDGHQIVKRKVAQFWDETAAYEHEAERIAEIGLANLTNVLPGGAPEALLADDREKARQTQKEKARPWTSDVAMTIVRNWPGWVAAWLRRPTPNSKLTVEVKGGLYPKFTAACLEMLVNTLLPPAWQKAVNDPKNHAELRSLLQPWNITLVFDPPTV
jgi:hypothetical protein